MISWILFIARSNVYDIIGILQFYLLNHQWSIKKLLMVVFPFSL